MALSWRRLLFGLAITIVVPVLSAALWLRWNAEPFNVDKVLTEAFRLTSRSWEYGALAEGSLELQDPHLSVFSQDPFPDGKLPCGFDTASVAALQHVKPLIWTNGTDELIGGEGSPADPASLGVSALLLSCNDQTYWEAARRQIHYLRYNATRFIVNDTHAAISHRDEPPQLWGDFVYMVPPFLAYYGAFTRDVSFMQEAVRQCKLYGQVLETNVTLFNGSSCFGLWKHIVSQPAQLEPAVCCSDPYVWLTSNAWALAGMTRVLATILNWHPPIDSGIDLDTYRAFVLGSKLSLLDLIAPMLDCLMSQSRDTSTGLLKNYLDGEEDPSTQWAFGDAAGTALVTSAVYRLAALLPKPFANARFLDWAKQNFDAVAKHVDENGRVCPVASVNGVPSKRMAEQTSEGQSVAILMYAAWRDCVDAGVCQPSWSERLRRIVSWKHG